MTERWSLTADFDPVGEGFEPSLLGDAADFYGFLLRELGEEAEDDIRWNGETVILHSPTIDPLAKAQEFILMHLIPKSIMIRRNERR